MAKKITNESLALMVQKEFEITRKEMATKHDLAELRKEMATKRDLAETKAELEEHIRDLGNDITRLERKIDGVPLIAEFDALRKRIERIEKKVGLAR